MTDWIEWNGGECPVADGTLVDVRHRDGDEFLGQLAWGVARPEEGNTVWAGAAFWHRDGVDGDIVAYRLVDALGASTETSAWDSASEAAIANSASALTRQPSGTHYSDAAIQPVQFIEANKLGFLEGCIVKRATRHNHPTGKGREDIEKIIHEAQLLLELRYGAVS